jgi:hypothetical protein
MLREGSGDWLLIRRGDTFQGGSGENQQAVELPAGRSATEPIVIGSYGSELGRPRLNGFEIIHNRAGNVAVIHLAMPDSLLVMSGTAANLLYEGCLIESGGISSVESKEDGPRRNVAIRRNVAVRSNTPFYFGSVNGLLIEENVIYRPGENGAGNHGMYLTRVGNSNVTTRGNLVYCGPDGEGDGIKQRPGGLAENNIIAESKLASLHFGSCNDGNDSVCEPQVEASAIGNLIVGSGGIAFQHDWITEGQARDNISADIPNIVDTPIDAPPMVTVADNVELRGPADAARPGASVLGLYSADVLDGDASTVAFFEAAIQQQKFGFRPELTAVTVIAHVRENYAP